MDRRSFLRFLGLGAAAAVAPTKAYSFLGGILRPRKELVLTPKSAIPFRFDPFISYYLMQDGFSWTTNIEEAGNFEFAAGDPGRTIPGQISRLDIAPMVRAVSIRQGQFT